MTVYSINRFWGPNAPLVSIVTDSAIEEILVEGWLAEQEADIIEYNKGEFEWQANDTLFINIINSDFETTYSNIFVPFPDHRSVNPISQILPNLNNIVAHSGGGQTDATQLNIGINVVTVVAAHGDSVKLPDDVLGQTVIVSNRGAFALALYPFLGDSIDQNAANAPIYVYPGETYILYGTATTNWASVNISPVLTSNQGIIAHAGGGQANATLLNAGLNVVSTVATANDSVKLPNNSIGQIFWVVNNTANIVDIYPPLGGNFQNMGANAPLNLAAASSNLITGATATLFAYK